jgi:hypothetical protein
VRRRAHVDANQPGIVKALRDLGCTVQPLHTVGSGCPDLLVGIRGWTGLIEIKNPNVPKGDRQLKATQVEWHGAWKGHPVAVVETVGDAVAFVIESTRGAA